MTIEVVGRDGVVERFDEVKSIDAVDGRLWVTYPGGTWSRGLRHIAEVRAAAERAAIEVIDSLNCCDLLLDVHRVYCDGAFLIVRHESWQRCYMRPLAAVREIRAA